MMNPYIIIVKENSRFTVDNNLLTIVPIKSVVETYSKKNDVDELGTMVKSELRTPGILTGNTPESILPSRKEIKYH